MRRPPAVLTGLLTGAVALSLLVACGATGQPAGDGRDAGDAGDAKDRVNAGVIAIVDTAPIHLGKSKGFFDRQNIDLTITPVQGGAASISGTVGNQFQFAFANTTSLLTARERGLDLKVVANGVSSTGEPGRDFGAVLVRADSPIRSAKDLAGKKVSVNQLKNIGDTTIRASVRKAGGDPSTIEFVELAFPDAPAALAGGRVDAAWVVEPFVSQALSQGARAVSWNFAEAVDDLTVAMYFTNAATDPDLVKRFTAAMNESLSYAEAHPEEAREILKSYTKIAPEVIAKINLPRWGTEINRESVQAIADLARGDGVLKSRADVAALIP